MRIDQLETDRLRFRSMRPDDVEKFQIFYSDPKLARFIVNEVDDPIESARNWVEANIRDNHFGSGQYAVEVKQKGDLIGSAGFIPIILEDDIEIEFCGRLLPNYGFRGYSLEAGKVLRDWAKRHENFKDHVSLVHHENYTTQKFCRKLGLIEDTDCQYEGIKVIVFRSSIPFRM